MDAGSERVIGTASGLDFADSELLGGRGGERSQVGPTSVDIRDQVRAHGRRPERPQVRGDLGDRPVVRVVGHVGSDLVHHAHQRCGGAHRCPTPRSWSACSLTGASEVGATWTAVTLYSGQLVAQSELSVVMMFAPLPG